MYILEGAVRALLSGSWNNLHRRCVQVVQLVQRMAEQLPSNKLQVVFLINNYHEVRKRRRYILVSILVNSMGFGAIGVAHAVFVAATCAAPP